MLVVFVAAIVSGIALSNSFLAFGVGLVALGVFTWRLMSNSGPRPIVAHETNNELEAHMLRNYLADHGVDARVEGGQSGLPYPGLIPARVVVPPNEAERTADLLREFLRQGHED